MSKPGFLFAFFFRLQVEKRQKPERQRETQKVKEPMWTETRNSSHKPAEKQNCLCLAISQLMVFFKIFIYISGASGSRNPCSLLGVWKSDYKGERERGRRISRRDGERLQCSRQSGTKFVLCCCKQEEVESVCMTQRHTGCLLALENKHWSPVSPCWKWLLNPGTKEKSCGC